MVSMSITEVAKLLGKSLSDERKVLKAYVDGRLCEEGGLYFALKGAKNHGHDFLDQAAKRGAIAAVVEEDYKGDDHGLTLIRVKDSLASLQDLSKILLKQRNPFVIGITGSVGKTTVKEFLGTLLETSYRVSKTPNSYNGQIGLPLTILNANPEAEILILEMGISYRGEMSRLIDLALPQMAIMTQVAPAHIGNFSSLGQIAEEKSCILHSDLQKAFIHEANQVYPFMQKESSFQKRIYGKGQVDWSFKQEGSQVSIVGKRKLMVSLPFSETHLVENFVIAALVAMELGVSEEIIQERAKHLKPFKHRFEKLVFKTHPKIVVVDDSYNNNPIALKTSLHNLPKPKEHCKTIAVLGEMRELGSLSKMAHEEAAITALPVVDVLVCYGPETQPIYEMFKKHNKEVYYTLDKGLISDLIMDRMKDGDVVFVKGANSNKLWEVLDQIQEKIC